MCYPQDGRNHLRHRCFSIATGHGNQWHAAFMAPKLRPVAQTCSGIWNLNADQAGLGKTVRRESDLHPLIAQLRQKCVRIVVIAR